MLVELTKFTEAWGALKGDEIKVDSKDLKFPISRGLFLYFAHPNKMSGNETKTGSLLVEKRRF